MKLNQRRSFLAKSGLFAGAALGWTTAGKQAVAAPAAAEPRSRRLPREVCLATVSLDGLQATDVKSMQQQVIRIMEKIVPQQPDVICLPETFDVANVRGSKPPLSERAADGIGEVAQPYADFAKKHSCCVVCPIHSMQDGRYYNSALFIDRNGELLGRYHKMHTTTDEMDQGIAPGPIDPPVFDTDFGRVGAQICFDIEWHDGWTKLAEAGAEIVFWPSAFAGGSMVNAKAWQHRYCVVSSTLKDTSKICGITGEEVAKTSRWNQWACAVVNLEKAFLHTWPYVQRFAAIQAKYGADIRITNYGEEEWSILESRSPDLRIADVLREFELKTIQEHLANADALQCSCR